ncbi:MAG: hypothetical protein JWN37_438 [Candidatus Nomurabacteria bacterium]|nr:hypothetical protein [Candidatus Nomurabacteria bacterium]
MTTVINNPGNGDNSGSTGWIIAILVIIVIVALFFGLPALRGKNAGSAGVNVNTTIPTGGSAGGTQ